MSALPIIAKLHEQVGTGNYYDDGFAMIGSDGLYESRPATQVMRPANRDGAEAAALITELYEALEELLESYLDALPGSEDYGPVLEANAALAKARGDQS